MNILNNLNLMNKLINYILYSIHYFINLLIIFYLIVFFVLRKKLPSLLQSFDFISLLYLSIFFILTFTNVLHMNYGIYILGSKLQQ